MMKISKILRNKVTFENGTEIPVTLDLIYEFGLKEGVEISDEEYKNLMEESAYQKALSILARQERSEKGLVMKLREYFRDGLLVEKTAKRVKDNGYLNDSEYAVSFLSGKNYSRKQALYELIKKGISKKEAESAVENSEIDESKILEKYVKKMAGKDERKIIESLMRKGFEYEDIKMAIKESRE